MEFTTKNNPNYVRRKKQLVNMININGPDFLVYQFAVNMLESMFGFSKLKLIYYIFRSLITEKRIIFKAYCQFKNDKKMVRKMINKI